jgi:hypothetical protein
MPGNVSNKWMSTDGADGQTIVVNDPGSCLCMGSSVKTTNA